MSSMALRPVRALKQRTKSDCGIVAVAHVTGWSYAKVKQMFGILRGGMEIHEIDWLLSNYGDYRPTKARRTVRLEDWLKRHKTGSYVVVAATIWDSHAIAVIDGAVYGECNPKRIVTHHWKKVS